MNNCEICNEPKKDDLFSFVTNERVCAICKIKYIGGLPTTAERIQSARNQLGLKDGEFLKQNNAAEAAKILKRR